MTAREELLALADNEDDQRCPDCGFLACICFDDDESDPADDLLDECGMMADGYCTLAGSEFCDWDCPRARARAGTGDGA